MNEPTGFGWNKAIQHIYGTAPKEEVMEPILDGQPRIDGKLFTARTAERRARFERAYMAALSGLMPLATEVDCGIPGLVRDAGMAALETIRQWDAMMAELEEG